MKKPLREGKPTLPLLVAMTRSADAERQLIRHAIEHGELDRLQDIIAIVRQTGALQATRQAARDEADAAARALSALPDSAARQALLDLCARSVERSS